MSFTKKARTNKLLAIVTAFMMAISVIGFVPSVAKAEEPPKDWEETFIIKGEAKEKLGDYVIYLSFAGYNKNQTSRKTVIIEKYNGTEWVEAGKKTNYDSAINSLSIYSSESGFSDVTFGVYLRAKVICGSETDYSDTVIVDDPNEDAPGGGGTPVGSDTPSTDPTEEQKTCPHDRGWTSADENGSLKCLKCGFICDHKANTNTTKKKEDWESMYEQGHKHKYTIVCSVCNRKELEFEDPIEPHDYTGSKAEYAGDDQHRLTCSKCGYNTLVKCDYEVKKSEYCTDSYFPDAAAKGHNATLVCKICGHEEKVTQEKHTLVDGKCTVCGWKKVKPGNISKVKIKVKSKKTTNKTFRSHGYFDYLGRWVSGKTTHSTLKICKVNISFKKGKNCDHYKIEKRPGSGTTMNDSWVNKKTNNTYEMWFKGGTGKVTIKITPYSKEGIKGKTVKKTIRI